ncbi:hypothetical protein Dimus_003490 [Dionaea muscipula]
MINIVEAIELYEKVVQLNWNSPQALNNWGLALQFKVANQLQFNFHRVIYNLGTVLELGINCIELMPCYEFNELEYEVKNEVSLYASFLLLNQGRIFIRILIDALCFTLL